MISDESREVLAVCETCERKLYEGDMAYSYSDGPTFCWQHSPTWNDVLREQEELIRDGIFEESYDTPEAAAKIRKAVLDRIANGEGDKLVASPL